MLVQNLKTIGNRLMQIRKRSGLTQAEVAEKADLSDRTYADIERGTANMRIGTFLQICEALHITPNEVLLPEEFSDFPEEDEMLAKLKAAPLRTRKIAVRILDAFLWAEGSNDK